MNLLLVEPSELAPDGTCVLRDRRREHLIRVLDVAVGSKVRAGVIGGRLGSAEVLAVDPAQLTLRLALDEPASTPLPVELILAMPRPKVLSRVIEIAASFGVTRIDLTNAWRVDKGYLTSPRLAADALAAAARLGAEQGATTHLPAIAMHARLMDLVDARWPREAPDTSNLKIIAHPKAEALESIAHAHGAMQGAMDPIVLAIGPEGGWIQREVDTFVARGFRAVSLGAPILRVEAAVAAMLGQILLVRRLADRAR
ncbi:MAG: 16S rRNA (uracil(1498)-N(3))-methyltransferase [Deltaproteobacteria bacterium]|nr:16S rRNA (uracil(1498)-N(3))-methyltransferase [Deltaproteobacteria bacterium]